MQLCERVAVVTGASRGIGQALAVRFAAEGATVLAVGRSVGGTGQLAGSLGETVELTARSGNRRGGRNWYDRWAGRSGSSGT